MGWYLVSYDVKTPHQSKVKSNLESRGFYAAVLMNGSQAIKLPNTTMAVEASSARDAADKFKAAAPSGIMAIAIIERFIVTSLTDIIAEGEAV